MAYIAAIFVALAALLHVYIFLMESVLWTRPVVWKRFGVRSQADAETTRPMAYNQGYYNLFLGLGATIGLVLFLSGQEEAGKALVLFSTAAMVGAATVLVTTGPGYQKAALIQGTFPLLGFLLFLFA